MSSASESIEWYWVVYAIVLLVLAASWVVGGPKWPPDEDSGGDE